MFKDFGFFWGTLIGGLLPLIIAVVISLIQIQYLGKLSYDIFNYKTALMGCLIGNIIMFRILMMNLKKYAMGKGLLLVTIIYAFIIIVR